MWGQAVNESKEMKKMSTQLNIGIDDSSLVYMELRPRCLDQSHVRLISTPGIRQRPFRKICN